MPKTADLSPDEEAEVRRKLASGISPADIVVTATKPGRKGAKRGEMNGLETDYALRLDRLKAAGEIKAWWYEAVKLKIAFGDKGAWFTVDFWVVNNDGTFEAHETKGWWREAARLRIKVAAGVYRFVKFYGVQRRAKKDGGDWIFEEF